MTARYPDIPRDFGFSEEHDLLRDAARRFLEERVPLAEVRRLLDDPRGHDPAVWKEMGALGWTGLGLPEAVGGAGMGALHQALLFEELGRALAPGPLFATTLAGLALAAAGDRAQQERWLAPVASGEQVATLAHAEADGSWEPEHVTAMAEEGRDGWTLHGVKAFVPSLAEADLLVAPFRCGGPGGPVALFTLPLPLAGARLESEVPVDPTRPTGRLVLDGVRVGAEARLAGNGEAALREVLLRGAALLAAEMVGGAERVLMTTVEYARTRVQFDHPIGGFQAVKHPLVDVMIAVETARSHAYAAAAAFDADPATAEVPARMAKAAAGETYNDAVRRGVQLHGGYGFTWDCDVHLYFKRALYSRAALGDAIHHRRHLARALLALA